ncbi:MAG TPA: APC family permease [Thermoanaerobaculia bacterium]|nr:APC family permease [Thermoanaerobaculia bacterium]
MNSEKGPGAPQLIRAWGIGDCVLFVVGSMVGTGIYLSAGNVIRKVPHPSWILLVWLVGGLHALAAGLTYAELGVRRPGAGGPYDYLRETFGALTAWLFTWAFSFVIMTGALAALSTGLAEYVGAILPALEAAAPALSLGPLQVSRGQLVAIALCFVATAWNMLGIREGGTLNNVLTVLKIGLLLAFVGAGLASPAARFPPLEDFSTPLSLPILVSAGAALAGVLWAYDGWVGLSALGAEVKNPRRDIPGGLWGGVLLVAGLYLAANVVYLAAAPVAVLGASPRAAETAMNALFGPGAARWLNLAILVSIAGSLVANVIPGPRVSYAAALDGRLPAPFGRLHPRHATPAFGLMAQAFLAALLVLSGTFDGLVATVASFGTFFYALGGAAIFIYRRREPEAAWKMPGYPWVPALYVGSSVLFAVTIAIDAPMDALRGAVVLAAGVAVYLWERRQRKQRDSV